MTRPYVHCWFKNSSTPVGGGATSDVIFCLSNAAENYFFSLFWDSTVVGGDKGLTYVQSNGTVKRARMTSSPSADTWYGIGGYYDGTNIGIVLNGTTEATTAATALSTSSSHNPTPCALSANLGVAAFSDGTVAEIGLWQLTTGFTTAEWASLAAGVSPLLIRPQSLVLYWPLISDAVAVVGASAITATNTTAAAHPRIYYPAPPQISYVDDVGSTADITMTLEDSCSFAEVNSRFPGDLLDTVTMTEALTLDANFGQQTDAVICTERYRAGTEYLAAGRLRDIPGSRRP